MRTRLIQLKLFLQFFFTRITLGNTVHADISPNSVNAGTNLQPFTYRFYDIDLADDSTSFGKLDRVAIANPFENAISVTRIQIDSLSVPIQNSSSAPTTPGLATWYYYDGVNDSLIIQTYNLM